jgi:predicted RNA-binding Zn ribbon-like protein
MPRQPSSPRPSTPWSRWQVSVTETAARGPLCLALANTRNWRNAAAPLERLNAFADLLRWGERQGLMDAEEIARLTKVADQRPRLAHAELAATVALREAVYRVFSARAHGRAPAADDLALFGAGFNDAVGQLELSLEDGKLAPRPRHADGGLEALRAGRTTFALRAPEQFALGAALRAHAALSAVALFTSAQGARVKECADDRGCGWLFVDTTRNGSRRFCFSNECGNRARQVAFRRRQRSGEDAPHNDAHRHAGGR